MFCYSCASEPAAQVRCVEGFILGKKLVFLMVLLLVVCLPRTARAQVQCNDANPSRPILFVHGFLDGSGGWLKVRSAVISDLSSAPGYGNPQDYDLYFDGANVRFSEGDPSTDPVANSSDIPCDARFFSIKFYGWVPGSLAFDSFQVAKISIITKAFELSEVIQAITGITFVKDVIVAAHSMGALDARAYVEGLGSAYDGPCFSYPCYKTGTLSYESDISHIVTLDGANGGSDLASLAQYFLDASDLDAYTGHLLNLEELEPGNSADPLIPTLNYQTFYNGVNAKPIPPDLSIDAIISQYSDGDTVPCTLSDSVCSWDNVVTSDSQSIEIPLKNQGLPGLTDYPDNYSTYDPTIGLNPDCYTNGYLALHLLPCLGDYHLSAQKSASQLLYERISPYTQGQLTQVFVTVDYNGQPYSGANLRLSGPNGATQITPSGQPAVLLGPQVPPSPQLPSVPNADAVPYELSYVSGAPSGAGSPIIIGTDASGQPCSPCYIKPGNWAITYNVNFTATAPVAPSVTTGPTSMAQGDGATLGATVNPNRTATSAWFEWGKNSDLSSFSSTTTQTLGAGNAYQIVSVTVSGLDSSSTYYYRVAASNGVEIARGSILSFTTLGTLPQPSLEVPSNGATGISATATFSWSTVANAASYRLIVATSPNALPTDPTVATCGSGCVLNVTPTGTAYSPASGVLNSGVTYYWEVHARSATQYGDWSAISSFTVGASAISNFSFQLTPTSQSVSQSNTVAFGIATATTGGQLQTVAFSVGNLPAGATAIFTPPLLNSGDSGVLGITTSSSTPIGTYTLTVVASGSSSSHSSQVSLTVTGASSGTPNVSAAPASWTFSDQTVGTIGPTRSFTVQNTGTGQLTVNNISLGTGGDYVFFGLTSFPLNIVAGGQFQVQVAFDPATTGQRPDHILIWDNAPGSPQIIPITGSGLAAPPTNGTIQVLGTLNGTPLPNANTFSYPFSYGISGPASFTGDGAETFTAAPGTYTASFSGSPGYLTLTSITPSSPQTVTAGATTTFTLNFTAQNDFLSPSFMYPANSVRAQIVPAGSTADYTVGLGVPSGSAATPITLNVIGTPLAANFAFNPQPVYSNTDSTLAVQTDPVATPIGAYTLTLNGTNSSGLTHPGDVSSLLVTAPPANPVALASVSTSGTQANADSGYTTNSAVTADGRFIVFQSTATNLVAGAPTGNGQTHVYLRDLQSGATTLVDLANDGTPANNGASNPTISSNGRYVAFISQSTNLPQPPVNGDTAVFVRDVQAGATERADVNSNGAVANGTFSGEPNVSADGHFIAFVSDATNLVPGITPTNSQIYLCDLDNGIVTLVSAAPDGSPANQRATLPSISADGRYVAFLSASTNLVQQNTGGLEQVFVRDLQEGQTVLASIGSDGSPANSSILANESAPALSADGRFVAFTSNATNLIPRAIDTNGDFRVFLRDLNSEQTKLIDTDSTGVPLSQGGTGPTISADGRFVAYTIYGQTIVRDLTGNRSVVVSVASDGTPGNNVSSPEWPPNMASSGRYIAFASSATNLTTNDTNNATDIFRGQNPLIGTPYVASIALNASQVGGGNAVTGTLSLSGAAPSSGASVMLSTDNDAAEVPPLVLVPPGAMSATFSFNTGIVSKETPVSVLASYNGSSVVAVLRLEPAAALTTEPSGLDFGDQPVDSTSGATAVTISNVGTAPLDINSIGLATGQGFKVTGDTCPSSLAAGNSCVVSVTFSPTVAGLASDSLQINSGTAGTLETVSLVGNGSTPGVSLSPGTVNFGSEVIQGSGLAIATLTNSGTAPLGNIRASIQGGNAADFTIASDNCTGTNLLANTSCLVTLNFSPSATGSRGATLSVSDNATGSPQTLSLSGNATDLDLGATATGSTSETITAGQTATYNLQINPVNGFSGQVSFSCAGQIPDGTCSVTPSTAAVTGLAVPFTVTVTTAANASLPLPAWRGARPMGFEIGVCVMAMLIILFFWSLFGAKRPSVGLVTMFALILLVALVSCGGGGNGNSSNAGSSGPSGTPAGNYTLIVTGASGGASRTVALSLTVK